MQTTLMHGISSLTSPPKDGDVCCEIMPKRQDHREGVAGATAPGPGPRQGPVKQKLCFALVTPPQNIHEILPVMHFWYQCQARGPHPIVAPRPGLTLGGPAQRLPIRSLT